MFGGCLSLKKRPLVLSQFALIRHIARIRHIPGLARIVGNIYVFDGKGETIHPGVEFDFPITRMLA